MLKAYVGDTMISLEIGQFIKLTNELSIGKTLGRTRPERQSGD